MLLLSKSILGESYAVPCCPSRPYALLHRRQGTDDTLSAPYSFVQTDMGNNGAAAWGKKQATFTVDETVPGIARVVSIRLCDASGVLQSIYVEFR
jgi:hypothetical protein